LNNICDRLVAALFFFIPSHEIDDAEQVGRIFCRLPAKEGQKLIGRHTSETRLASIRCEVHGEPLVDINVNKVSGDPPSLMSLCLEVTCPGGVPATGAIKLIDVEMRSLAKHAKFPWLPISGTPYII